MTEQRLPGILLAVSAAGFAVWGIVLLITPGGPAPLEWTILVVGVLLLGLGSWSLWDEDRIKVIRWILTGFAVFGAVVVIGLTADNSSSRTWMRLGWAALVVGYVTCLAAWYTAPRVSRTLVIGGGVLGAIVIAAGVGITANCDKTLQRSWCEPAFEQEESLAARIRVEGTPQREGRAGGDTGAYIRAFLVEGTDIEAVTRVPEPFRFEPRDIQSIEVARGRYTASSGPDSNCQVDVKIEQVPAGTLQTITVSCTGKG